MHKKLDLCLPCLLVAEAVRLSTDTAVVPAGMLIVNPKIAPVTFDDVEDETYVLVFHVRITRLRSRDRSIEHVLRLGVVSTTSQPGHLQKRIRQFRDRLVFLDLEIDERVT